MCIYLLISVRMCFFIDYFRGGSIKLLDEDFPETLWIKTDKRNIREIAKEVIEVIWFLYIAQRLNNNEIYKKCEVQYEREKQRRRL